MKIFDDIFKETPYPSSIWQSMSDKERLDSISRVLTALSLDKKIAARYCDEEGFIFIEFLHPISASERGALLLDLELELKERIDEGLTVWHYPQGDKSSLRRLRGVKPR